MRARRLALLALVGAHACGGADAGNPPPPPATIDSAAIDIAAQLEQVVWNQSPPPWTTDARWALMRRVYDGAHYAPLWVGREGPTATGRAMIDALCAALDEGIHPAAFVADSSAWDTTTAAALAETDLRISAAVFGYLTALAAGQVGPETVGAAWRAPAPAPPADTALVHALRRPLATSAALLRPAGGAYSRLRNSLARYRAAALDGAWTLPDSLATLTPGVRDSAVLHLRRRLIRSRDLAAGDSAGTAYDRPVVTAVQRAQRRLGIAADGIVGPATWSALAVPAAARARAIAANLERYRWVPRHPAGTALVLDAAAGSVELRTGPEALFAARARVTDECIAAMPPMSADTIRGARPAAGGLMIELAGGRSLVWGGTARPGRTADTGCVSVDELDWLATAMERAAPPVFLYVIAPTAHADSGGRVRFRPDTSGADRRLEAALAPILSRPAPAACAVSSRRRPVRPPSGAPSRVPLRPSPAPGGTGSARRAD